MADLADILDRLNKNVLSGHAPLIGSSGKGRKHEIVADIAGKIHASPVSVLNACDKAEKLLLAELAHSGGVIPGHFAIKYDMRFPKMERWGYGQKKGSVLVLMTDNDENMACTIADDLRETFRKLLPLPSAPTVATVEQLPDEYSFTYPYGNETVKRPIRVYEGMAQVFEEGRRILTLIQQGKIRISNSTKRPTAAATKTVANALLTPDFDLELPDCQTAVGPVRAHLWPVIVQQCGWAKPQGTKLVLMRSGIDLLKSTDAELWRKGFERLLNDRVFDELHRVPNIRGQTGRGKRTRTPTDERRLEIADAMSEWPVGQWIAFEDAFRFGIASGNHFTVNRNLWNLYFGEHGYGCLNDGDERDLARQYLRLLLFETFATLGIVDVAYVQPHHLWPEFRGYWGTDDLDFCGCGDGLLYVRLNALGAYCLRINDQYQTPVAEGIRLRVLANRDVIGIDSPELPAAICGLLELYAKRRSDAVWRLDEKRIVTHLEHGGAVDDLRELLAQHDAGELPETVKSFLCDIERRATAVKGVEDAVIVHFRDKITAALIANDTTARKFCSPAGASSIVVPRKKEKAFRTFLRHKGYPMPPQVHD